jgi:hypothetical protein
MILFLCNDGFVEAFHEIDLDENLLDSVVLLLVVGQFTDPVFCEEVGLSRAIKKGDELLIENRRFVFDGRAFNQEEVFEVDGI